MNSKFESQIASPQHQPSTFDSSSSSSASSSSHAEGFKRKSKSAQILSLAVDCHKAQNDGWTQITHCELAPLAEFDNQPCQFESWAVASPHFFSPEIIFRRMFGGVVQELVNSTCANLQAHHIGPQPCRRRTDEHEMWALLAVFIRFFGRSHKFFKETVRSAEFRTWNSLSVTKTEGLPGQLFASSDTLLPAFNDGLNSILKVGGVSAVDETVSEWHGQSPFLITIPRKPHPTGFRIYMHIFRLKASRHPVLVRCLPELIRPCYKPEEVLHHFSSHINAPVYSLTADSYFGSIAWLQSHAHVPSVVAL